MKNYVWTFAHDASELSGDVSLGYDRGAALRLSSTQVGTGDAALPLYAQQVALWRLLCAAGFNGRLDDLVELLQRSTQIPSLQNVLKERDMTNEWMQA